MPHLSPMSWTLALIFLWLMSFLLMTITFFSSSSSFMKPSYESGMLKPLPWPWMLQDGRDMNNKL